MVISENYPDFVCVCVSVRARLCARLYLLSHKFCYVAAMKEEEEEEMEELIKKLKMLQGMGGGTAGGGSVAGSMDFEEIQKMVGFIQVARHG